MKLDRQQESAVITEAKKTLVIAGAGSGKTRVLTERIAYLIEAQKVSPYEILAFTFTRKAAGEIRERLETRLETKAGHITVGTMHAIALKMLHKFGNIIGLKAKQLTVYSQWETDYLLKDVAAEMGIFKKSWKIPKKDIDRCFADYYEKGQEPLEDNPVHDLFQAFVQRCRENNALTYGALLTGFVDEIQDIDILQWSIINELCENLKASLFVVGDVDQSIYSWRGAVPEYLIEHQHEFKIYRLETNYRSDKNIVTAANNLIKHNMDRIPKTMVAFEDAQTSIETVKNVDSAGIVQLIKKLNKTAPEANRQPSRFMPYSCPTCKTISTS
jgi:DNA helicase-2/ATP-dependent DNA helicase PcrA